MMTRVRTRRRIDLQPDPDKELRLPRVPLRTLRPVLKAQTVRTAQIPRPHRLQQSREQLRLHRPQRLGLLRILLLLLLLVSQNRRARPARTLRTPH